MHRMGDGIVDHLDNVVLNVLALEHLQTLCVDGLTLGVQYVIVLENVLTNAEVAGFDLLLGIFDRAGQNLLIDRLIIGNARVSIMFWIRSEPNRRMRSSSSEM